MNLSGSTLLLLEDEPLVRKRIAAHLEATGAEITALKSLSEARHALRDLHFDFALLDVNLPDGRSISLLENKEIPENTVAIVMTAEGGIAGAVEAMRLGAADYLVKPFDLDELAVRLARAKRHQQGRRTDQHLREQQGQKNASFVFGEALAGVRQQLEKIVAADRRLQSGTPSPVLLEGETGTGKTTLARWIHQHGPRAAGPLVEVNCSALPETLAESELFGYERGAFTDAKESRLGLLEAAEGGTLFLDELPSLASGTQAKLLKAIEDGEIRRLGATRTVRTNCRIIAATNADLVTLVQAGKFREDLLHRLNLFRVRIPPLRERGDDIVALAQALAARIAQTYGLPVLPIPPLGLERLKQHDWRGNVRELAHEIERSLVFEEDRLTFQSLARASDSKAKKPSENWLNSSFVYPESGFLLEEAIDTLIRRAIEQSNDNISAAARLLGVSRDYIRYRQKGARPE